MQVSDEGVQSVIADLQKINAGLDVTDAKARRTATNVSGAQGKGGGGGLEGFLGRARDSGFFRHGSLTGMMRGQGAGQAAGPLFAAYVVSRVANKSANALENFADARDFVKDHPDWTALQLANQARLSASERVLDFFGVTTLAGGLDRAINGTRADLSGRLMSDFLAKTFRPEEYAKSEAEYWAKRREVSRIAKAGREKEQREFEEARDAISRMQENINRDLARGLAGIRRETKLGFRWSRPGDTMQALQEMRDWQAKGAREQADRMDREASANYYKLVKNSGR